MLLPCGNVILLAKSLSNEKILNKMGNKMNEGMVAPYRKLLEPKK